MYLVFGGFAHIRVYVLLRTFSHPQVKEGKGATIDAQAFSDPQLPGKKHMLSTSATLMAPLTCQGFLWNPEIFIPSYIDYTPLENSREPIHEIFLSDEEIAQMFPE
ncbi:hypothetical protein SEPCBS119000_000722 [Sporothrix epigloea]|uniref:Uncharacterized protein n=1 Tax=Sporothrix epigloea TaxID=1892477 RepID=A0ABP0D6S2_9PEZI